MPDHDSVEHEAASDDSERIEQTLFGHTIAGLIEVTDPKAFNRMQRKAIQEGSILYQNSREQGAPDSNNTESAWQKFRSDASGFFGPEWVEKYLNFSEST